MSGFSLPPTRTSESGGKRKIFFYYLLMGVFEMFEKFAQLDSSTTDAVIAHLNSLSDNLYPDVSNYARGRQRFWIGTEYPLSLKYQQFRDGCGTDGSKIGSKRRGKNRVSTVNPNPHWRYTGTFRSSSTPTRRAQLRMPFRSTSAEQCSFMTPCLPVQKIETVGFTHQRHRSNIHWTEGK